MRHLLFTAVTLTALAPRALADDNPHLARARAELNDLRYDKAKETLEQALKWGKSSPAETAEIYRLSGEVAAAFGDARKAEEAFGRLLSIDPSVRLAAGVSPRIAGPFNAAQKSAQSRGPIKIHHETRTGEAPTITLVIDSDPLGLVKGARASFEGPGGKDAVEDTGSGRIELKLPPAPRITVTLAAIDEHGNRLAELGADDPIVVEAETVGTGGGETIPEGEGDQEPPDARPFYSRWYLWGGVALGFAGAGTYFGLKAKSAEDDIEKLNQMTREERFSVDFAEAKKIEDRARKHALIANVNFAAAGAFAVVGGIFLVLELKAKSAAVEESTALAPMPLPGGAGVAFTTEF